MNIIYFLIIGGVAGWLASMFCGGAAAVSFIILLLVVLELFLGGWLFGGYFLGLGIIGDLCIAFLGALILIFILKLVLGSRGSGGGGGA